MLHGALGRPPQPRVSSSMRGIPLGVLDLFRTPLRRSSIRAELPRDQRAQIRLMTFLSLSVSGHVAAHDALGRPSTRPSYRRRAHRSAPVVLGACFRTGDAADLVVRP